MQKSEYVILWGYKSLSYYQKYQKKKKKTESSLGWILRINRCQHQVTDKVPSNCEFLQFGAMGDSVAVKPLIPPFRPLGPGAQRLHLPGRFGSFSFPCPSLPHRPPPGVPSDLTEAASAGVTVPTGVPFAHAHQKQVLQILLQ